MNRSEIAVNKFKEGYNCAQSVLFSFADMLDISENEALKLATGFGGGMGRKQEVCGAISGGILVLSLLHGRGENDDRQNQEITYAEVRQLIERFEEKYSTVNCSKLLDGCVLETSEGQEQFKADNLILKCHDYVDYTVTLLDNIIAK